MPNQLRILPFPFFCKENFILWPMGRSTPQEEQKHQVLQPHTVRADTLQHIPPAAADGSSASLSQRTAILRWVFHAIPLLQRGKYHCPLTTTRWGDSTMKMWFSTELLCTSQVLFFYVTKSLQEARTVLCNASELGNNCYLCSGCLPTSFIFLLSLQYHSSAIKSWWSPILN